MALNLDIFVSGGNKHHGNLKYLLPRLKGRGVVHLVSSHLGPRQINSLERYIDVLHEPAYSSNGYQNFKLFCLRDINTLCTRSWFVKIDADVLVREDWANYVHEVIETHPELLLFGPQEGRLPLDWQIQGSTVRHLFGQDIDVHSIPKVVGGFYCGRTEFFRKTDLQLKALTEIVYCFKGREKIRPTPTIDAMVDEVQAEVFLRGSCTGREGRLTEDNLRNLIVCVLGNGAVPKIIPDSRITVPPATKNSLGWIESFQSRSMRRLIRLRRILRGAAQ